MDKTFLDAYEKAHGVRPAYDTKRDATAIITAGGSWGYVTADAVTGVVLAYDDNGTLTPDALAEAEREGYVAGYGDVVRFDLDEWKQRYPGEVLDSPDILDLGYWYWTDDTHTATGYEGPEEDWRKMIDEMRTEGEAETGEPFGIAGHYASVLHESRVDGAL